MRSSSWSTSSSTSSSRGSTGGDEGGAALRQWILDSTGLRLRLDAGNEDGNSSSSSRARFLRLAVLNPRLAADMLERSGELQIRISSVDHYLHRT
jgi:hypothetical protein